MKKKTWLLALVVCLALAVALTGCGNKQAGEQKSTASTEQATGQSTGQPAENASQQPSTQSTAPAQEQNAGQPATQQQAAQPAEQGATGKTAGNNQPAASTTKPQSSQPAAKPAKPAQQPAAKPAAQKTPFEDYLYSMPVRFLPDVAKGVTAVYQFNLTDGSKGKYYAIIKDGKCTVGKGDAPATPTLVINTGEQLWLDMATGKVNGTLAYLKKQFTIQGSTDDLQEMKKYFKPYGG
ncbi:SCP2 sterol-binding domain-containing protein [Desulfurispora thermophila]|uniref:SCP2 sterol-binding domain-containing protein n=1 Tax=Desulfurispora thermophila TaxID=265470 RepID=UPI00035F4F45|nr:SCP2 sterol-binding domain-containing protein [Desulfurispora thermophila]